MIRVVHVGGVPTATAALCRAESALVAPQGDSSAMTPTSLPPTSRPATSMPLTSILLGSSPHNAPFSLPAQSPICCCVDEIVASGAKILVIHGTNALLGGVTASGPQLAQDLQRIRNAGIRVVYWAQGYEPLVHERERSFAKLDQITLSSLFDGILVATPTAESLGEEHGTWAWLSVPVAPIEAEDYLPREYDKSGLYELNLLHIPFQCPTTDTARIHDTLLSFKPKTTLTLVEPADFTSYRELVRKIQSCDAVVEHLGRPYYGIVGAITLAAGRPLLSGNAVHLRSRWRALELSPAIDIFEHGLAEQLSGLVREPRTLRDFGKRARIYAETFHSPTRIAAATRTFYQRLLKDEI